MKKKQFFRNFITIMLFGAVGTLISCTIISLGTFFIHLSVLLISYNTTSLFLSSTEVKFMNIWSDVKCYFGRCGSLFRLSTFPDIILLAVSCLWTLFLKLDVNAIDL